MKRSERSGWMGQPAVLHFHRTNLPNDLQSNASISKTGQTHLKKWSAWIARWYVYTLYVPPATRLNLFLEVGVVWQRYRRFLKDSDGESVGPRQWSSTNVTNYNALNGFLLAWVLHWDICHFWYMKWTWIVFREALIITLLLYFLRSLGVVTCGWVIKLTHWPTGQVDPSTKSNLLAITFYLMGGLTCPYGRV